MRSETRKQFAEVGFISLIIIGIVILGAMIVLQFTAKQSISNIWQVPFGAVLVLLGAHSIYFRSELAEIGSMTKRNFLSRLFFASLAGQYSPWMFLLGGIGIMLLGITLIFAGLSRR